MMHAVLPRLLLLLLPSVWGEYLAINWSDVEALGLRPNPVIDPAVTSLAPCPCDLTMATCDLNCCCDEDCSKVETTSFTCLEGLEGGQETNNKHPEYMCQYWGPYSSEWHDLLCIIIENTPYLGHFYKNELPIRDFKAYLSRVRKPHHSYKYRNENTLDQNFHKHYILGSPLETLLITNDSESRGVLFLPQRVLGLCISVPVYFLEDFGNKCPIQITPSVCENDPILSVETYLSESGNFEVIGNLTSLETVNISVVYECIDDNTLEYLKIRDIKRPLGFGNRENKENTYKRFGNRENIENEDKKECQEIKLPYYNEFSQICENVVLSVEYSFGWSGPFIYEVQVRIKLGNIPVVLESYPEFNIRVPLESDHVLINLIDENPTIGIEGQKSSHNRKSKVSLIQHFAVSFYHIPVSTVSEISVNMSTDDVNSTEGNSSMEDNVLELSERSGNPGYQLNRPLLAGYTIFNTTIQENSSDSDFLYVEVNSATGFYVWRPDATGDCNLAKKERVDFGSDVISSCLYHWTRTLDCHQLRKKLKILFSSLIQGDVVSKLGWPNVSVENDFLPIIMDDGGTESTIRKDSESVSRNSEESVTSNPWTISDETDDETTIQSDDDYDGEVISENGRCLIPYTLEYQIIYEDFAQPRFIPTYQIIGVLARLLYRDIQLSSNTSQESIALTSSAIFIKKPKQSGLSRFWESMEDPYCSRGTCWYELLYPWTHSKDGMDSLLSLTAITTQISTLTANTILLAVLSFPIVVVSFC